MADQPTPDPQAFEDPLSNYEPPVYGSRLEEALAEKTVADIQTKPYVEVVPTTTVREAIGTLRRLGISCLLVVDKGKLAGVFTERDVLGRVADRFDQIADQPIRDVMTHDPLIVYDGDSAATAMGAITAAGYRHVPVLSSDADYIVGVISPRRVFAFMEDFFD